MVIIDDVPAEFPVECYVAIDAGELAASGNFEMPGCSDEISESNGLDFASF